MKKILITGVNSFVGNALESHLARFPGKYCVKKISLRDDKWKNHDLGAYDCIVHVSGIAHVPYTDSMAEKYMAVNRDLTLEFARAAKNAGARHFIFLSSMIVYGPAAPAGSTRVISPDTPPAPENAYGQSKLEAETGLFAMADEGFAVSALRVPTVYGRGCRGAYASIAKMARLLRLFPHCRGRRSVIYIENLSEAIRLIADERAGGIFFPQDSEYATTADFVREIRAAHGKKTHITNIFAPFIMLLAETGPARKIFGGIVYEMDMSRHPDNYRLFAFKEAVKRTEED
jgi:nucleoside-diphosphate-sugar epimerase